MKCSECENGEIIFIQGDNVDWYQCDDCGCDLSTLEFDLKQQNAKMVSSLRKIAGVKLGGPIDDSVMANHMILEAQQTLAEVRG